MEPRRSIPPPLRRPLQYLQEITGLLLKPRHLISLSAAFVFALAVLAALAVQMRKPKPGAPAPVDASPSLPDAPLARHQRALLEMAFQTATAIPVKPHIKDRSKAQESVVAVCLELDQPKLAFEYLKSIEDWRQGSGLAELALHCAKKGRAADATAYLEAAGEAGAGAEDWRRDQIRVKLAQTAVLLGREDLALRFETGVGNTGTGKVAGFRAENGDADSFVKLAPELNAILDSPAPDLDATRNALKSYVKLFDRHYDSPENQAMAENKIRASWNPLPVIFRIELLMDMSAAAASHSDYPKAIDLAEAAQVMMDQHEWPLENRLAMMGRLAEARFRAGDKENAKAAAGQALELFRQKGTEIVDIWRAGALRPVAGAFAAMDGGAETLAAYKLVLEEGARNPNARPRAEDLSATCVEMAKRGIDPGDELWAKIRAIRDGLVEPW